VTVRTATAADVDRIVAFDHVAQRDQRRIALIRRTIDCGRCFVFEATGVLAGYAALEYSFYDNGFVAALYVHPEHQHQGIGTRLMQHLESTCETEKLFTSTNLSNLRMHGLLAKLGYQLSGVIENLDPGDPELVYFKRPAVPRVLR
jgi:N-acetylglutamate synthase-like GNAT family acetyltransferase